MELVYDITRLRDDSLSSLDASHDYFVHTKDVWRIVQQLPREGHEFTVRNRDTGTTVDEIKASRDVLVHNNGIANLIYVDKSMGRARFADGEKLELPESYHRESWLLIQQVVKDLSEAATAKLKKTGSTNE